LERSWSEQENYLVEAVEALPTDDLQVSARHALTQPARAEVGTATSLSTVELVVDQTSGALISCVDARSGSALLEAEVGLLRYQAYGEGAYAAYRSHYVRRDSQDEWWISSAFDKPGLSTTRPWRQREWLPRLRDIRTIAGAQLEGVEVALEFQVDDSDVAAAVPKGVRIRYLYHSEAQQLEVEVSWPEKAPTRFPEAMWCSFGAPNPTATCYVTKLGIDVCAHNIVLGGARATHAVAGRLLWRASDGSELEITTTDTPLVCVGDPYLLTDEAFPPSLGANAHFNLFNNLWCTNYPQWMHGASRHNFRVRRVVREEARDPNGRTGSAVTLYK
jgi:hypothetical protein